jgi:hypothetical protein
VVYLDDFEGVLKWSDGAGGVAKTSSDLAFEASNCLTVTTAAVAGETAITYLYLGGIPASKVALQLRWNVYNADREALRYFTINIQRGDGTYENQASIRYANFVSTVAANKWQYLGSDGVWHDITDGSELIESDFIRHQPLYFAVDFGANLKYSKLITSILDLDLSALSFYRNAAVTVPYIFISFEVETDKDIASVAAIDALLLSDEEE